MHASTHWVISTAAALALGCGSLGGDGGGAANLPNRGIVPYQRVDTRVAEGSQELGEPSPEDALVVPDADGVRFLEPSALMDDGGVRLFVEVADATGHWIGTSRSEEGMTWPRFEPALVPADVGSTATSVGSPSVVALPDGAWRVAFGTDDGAGIGIAEVVSDGVRRVSFPVVAATDGDWVGEPSLVATDGGAWWLYYTRVSAGDGEALPPVILRTVSADGWDFGPAELALEPGTDCVDPSGEPEPCWDRDGGRSPEVREARTALGRTIYRMWYSSAGDIGFASSFDGVTWERFPYNPVLDDRQAETGATNVWDGRRYLLYFSWRSSARGAGIALAINDAPAASETF